MAGCGGVKARGAGRGSGDSYLNRSVCVISCKGGEYLPLFGGLGMSVMGKMRAAAIAGVGFALGLGGVLSAAPGEDQAASAGVNLPEAARAE